MEAAGLWGSGLHAKLAGFSRPCTHCSLANFQCSYAYSYDHYSCVRLISTTITDVVLALLLRLVFFGKNREQSRANFLSLTLRRTHKTLKRHFVPSYSFSPVEQTNRFQAIQFAWLG